MYRKTLLISSLALVCSCTDLDRTRTILEYTKPKEDTKAFVCMKECQRLKDKCDNFTMSDTAIIGEDRNGNVCTNDYAKCLQSCDIDVTVIEKKVDFFGFPEDNGSAKSTTLVPATSKVINSNKNASSKSKTANKVTSKIAKSENFATTKTPLKQSTPKDVEVQSAQNTKSSEGDSSKPESKEIEDKDSHSNSFFKYEFDINKRKRLDQF